MFVGAWRWPCPGGSALVMLYISSSLGVSASMKNRADGVISVTWSSKACAQTHTYWHEKGDQTAATAITTSKPPHVIRQKDPHRHRNWKPTKQAAAWLFKKKYGSPLCVGHSPERAEGILGSEAGLLWWRSGYHSVGWWLPLWKPAHTHTQNFTHQRWRPVFPAYLLLTTVVKCFVFYQGIFIIKSCCFNFYTVAAAQGARRPQTGGLVVRFHRMITQWSQVTWS